MSTKSELVIEDQIKLKDYGRNKYVILDRHAGSTFIRCISFVVSEDTGDGIHTTALDQGYWIADYFLSYFEKIAD